MDSYARDNLLFLTGSRNWENWDPVDLHLSWISQPDYWQKQPLVRISHPDVRRQLMVDAARSRFTPEELFRNPVLMQYANTMAYKPESQAPMGGQKQGARDQELRRVVERLTLFRNLISGDGWPVVPHPEPEPWGVLKSDTKCEPSSKCIDTAKSRIAFSEVIRAYHVGDREGFAAASAAASSAIAAELTDASRAGLGRVSSRKLFTTPGISFFWAWIVYLIASLGWVLRARVKTAVFRPWVSWGPLGVAFALHTVGFVFRMMISGRPPVSNMYESVIWVSYGTLVFAFFVYAKFRHPVIPLCPRQFFVCIDDACR